MVDLNRIKLRGTVFSYQDYKNSRIEFNQLLATAHSAGERGKCLCGQHMPELYIVHRSGQFFLARMPNTGSFHDSQCAFYESPSEHSGRGGYAEGAIKEEGEEFDVKLGIPLTIQRAENQLPAAAISCCHTHSTRRSSVGLMGLLHFLWEQSSNNRWFPYVKGKKAISRQWGGVHYFLVKAAESIKVRHVSLNESLYVVPEFDKSKVDARDAAFAEKMQDVLLSAKDEAVKKNAPIKMMLLLGEVKTLAQSKYGYELRFRGMSRPFYLKNELHTRVSKSHKPGLDAVTAEDGRRSIALSVISASKNGNLNIDSMALMATTRNYLPIDSSFEKTVADMLIEQERQFEKPLRYDNDELTLPDFVLLDCADRVQMEIYGMTGNDEYDARKAEKRSIYQKAGTVFWEWEPALQDRPPPFPVKQPRKT